MDKHDRHHWSGWPGACCLKCGSEDPMENAIGLNYYDPHTEKWISDEIRQEVMDSLVCPVKGVLEWDDTDKKWNLIKGPRIVNLGSASIKLKAKKWIRA